MTEPVATTAFLVIRRFDGSFYATTNLAQEFDIERDATVADVNQGCQEVAATIQRDMLRTVLTGAFLAGVTSPEPSVADKMKAAIDKRGLAKE